MFGDHFQKQKIWRDELPAHQGTKEKVSQFLCLRVTVLERVSLGRPRTEERFITHFK